MVAPLPFLGCDLAGVKAWVFGDVAVSTPFGRFERRVEDDGCRVVSAEEGVVVSGLGGDLRFREFVDVGWVLEVEPVPAGVVGRSAGAAGSGAEAEGCAAAWLAARRAADLVSLSGMGSA